MGWPSSRPEPMPPGLPLLCESRPASWPPSREQRRRVRSLRRLQRADDRRYHAGVRAGADPDACTVQIEADQGRGLDQSLLFRRRGYRRLNHRRDELWVLICCGSRLVASCASPCEELRRRQSMPPRDVANTARPRVTLRQNRGLLFGAPFAPASRTRENFNPPRRLRHMIVSWHRHMSKLLMLRLLPTKSAAERWDHNSGYGPGPGLVDEDQPFRFDTILIFCPLGSPPCDLGTIAFASHHAFF